MHNVKENETRHSLFFRFFFPGSIVFFLPLFPSNSVYMSNVHHVLLSKTHTERRVENTSPVTFWKRYCFISCFFTLSGDAFLPLLYTIWFLLSANIDIFTVCQRVHRGLYRRYWSSKTKQNKKRGKKKQKTLYPCTDYGIYIDFPLFFRFLFLDWPIARTFPICDNNISI